MIVANIVDVEKDIDKPEPLRLGDTPGNEHLPTNPISMDERLL
jgi:hypothetical protein